MNYPRDSSQNPASIKQADCTMPAASPADKGAACCAENWNKARVLVEEMTAANPSKALTRLLFAIALLSWADAVKPLASPETMALFWFAFLILAAAVIMAAATSAVGAARIEINVWSMRRLLSERLRGENHNHTNGMPASPHAGGRP